MKGDFSSWRYEREQNFNGVLHQQGKVLLDNDWNAQTTITNEWQDTAGKDIIGAGVAAVPATTPDSFSIKKAALKSIVGDQSWIELTVAPGRVWADGLLAHLYGATDVVRIATYLQPPIQSPAGQESDIDIANDPDLKDAVVLELWREEINGFQLPGTLIEPALGGPDTTERVHTAMAFRLMRLADGDTCESIVDQLKDDFTNKGHLTVTLDPAEVSDEDCPVAEGGGYTGFEHNLYRIEVARVDSGAPMFKWSQFNGGLVGRGEFDPVGLKVKVTANSQAISTSGLNDFYLEAMEYEPSAPGLGYWRVTYGAKVTLNNNGELTLPDPLLADSGVMFGEIPTPTDPSDPTVPLPVFFRLWNGISAVSDFSPGPVALKDGINLAFNSTDADDYTPGDYWSFPVRAGEISNLDPLVDNQPPEGIEYHRVPLAILRWSALELTPESGTIEDCRHIFQPLTRRATCCTYRVGDGMLSHGDFTSIQEAINHLTPEGGEICVLPGNYREKIKIERKFDITIKGCGQHSRIALLAAEGAADGPVIHVLDSDNIRIESLQIVSDVGVGVLLEGQPIEQVTSGDGRPLLENITLEKLDIRVTAYSAIEAHVGYFITIRDCDIKIGDVTGNRPDAPGVFFVGEDSLIENNIIRVIPQTLSSVNSLLSWVDAHDPAEAAFGGLQLGGTSERIRVINNLIHSGIGTGITLGSLITMTATGTTVTGTAGSSNQCPPCEPGNTAVPAGTASSTYTNSTGALYEIHIERNRILNMGLNGIGVVGFFDLYIDEEFISVHGMLIEGNVIRRCLNRPLAAIPSGMRREMGYGGIALADVEYLVIRDNFIEDNGPDAMEPICGIYVLHAEGIDISRNRILNNGAKPQNTDSANDDGQPKRGQRGGIILTFALAPIVYTVVDLALFKLGNQNLPVQNGVPAVKVHDNVVSVPLGQALMMIALGPVSVVGNQFTSRGIVFDPTTLSFLASTVFILNLGFSNEFYLQLMLFVAVQKGHLTASGNISTEGTSGEPGGEVFGQYLTNGNVLFSNNQCLLDLIESGFSWSLTSIVIFSLDDVGFHNNQCECNLWDDIILGQAFVFGISVRVSDNRFKEGLIDLLATHALWMLSAVTFGLLNTTTDNQATHCLLVLGALVVNQHNLNLVSALLKRDVCQKYDALTRKLAGGDKYKQDDESTLADQTPPASDVVG